MGSFGILMIPLRPITRIGMPEVAYEVDRDWLSRTFVVSGD
jgi:hypothetical protein